MRSLDLGLTPNLERLDLHGCNCLEELHVHGGCLKSLVYLNLFDCKILTDVSFIKHLESLEELHIDSLSLQEFEYIIPAHSRSNLLKLRFYSRDIKQLPSSFSNLHKLVYLNLTGCKKLKSLPANFSSLRHLRILMLEICGIEKLPDDFGLLESLEELALTMSNIREIPSSFCNLKRLKRLSLLRCLQLKKLPEKFGDLECLQVLYVRGTPLTHLPRGISSLKGLEIIGYANRANTG